MEHMGRIARWVFEIGPLFVRWAVPLGKLGGSGILPSHDAMGFFVPSSLLYVGDALTQGVVPGLDAISF